MLIARGIRRYGHCLLSMTTGPVNFPAFTPVFIPWDTETEDTDNAHSTTANPDIIRVPAWAKHCIIHTQGQFIAPTLSGMYDVFVEKTTGGTPLTEFTGNIEVIYYATAGQGFSWNVTSGMMPVVPGDSFRIGVFNLSAGTSQLGVPNTNFADFEFFG